MSNNITKPLESFQSIDDFACGGLVIDENKIIVYANNYLKHEFGWLSINLVGNEIDKILTRSSKIFYQSYLVPLLLHDKKCEEIQLNIMDATGKRIPVIVNVNVDESGFSYWSLFNASKRDKLYQELINTREQLEVQAESLKSLASIDELTGLLNRREIIKRSKLLLDQAARSNFSVCFVMLDIDYFKKVNDDYGHTEGDRILSELGQCLGSFGRKTDLIGRYGGEEFLLVFPDTDADTAVLLSKRLHEKISIIKTEDKPITVSMGISTNKILDSTYDEIFHQADVALYQAKNLGRNRTQLYDSENIDD